MFSFMFDFSELGDPSQLSQQADLNCWAEGRMIRGGTRRSPPEIQNSIRGLKHRSTTLGLTSHWKNVRLTGDLEAGENIRLSFFVVNGGEQLPAFQRHH